jgi:hypothetical protein
MMMIEKTFQRFISLSHSHKFVLSMIFQYLKDSFIFLRHSAEVQCCFNKYMEAGGILCIVELMVCTNFANCGWKG